MEQGNVQLSFPNNRLPHEGNLEMMSCRKQYGVPENYNPSDHPPVKLRNNNNSDQSETQRKRRSKNRLSNRRSTGFVSPDVVAEALKMGNEGNTQESAAEKQ